MMLDALKGHTMITTDSGLQYEDTVTGNGDLAEAGRDELDLARQPLFRDAQLAVIVEKPDDAVARGDSKRHPDEAIGKVGPEQRR